MIASINGGVGALADRFADLIIFKLAKTDVCDLVNRIGVGRTAKEG